MNQYMFSLWVSMIPELVLKHIYNHSIDTYMMAIVT